MICIYIDVYVSTDTFIHISIYMDTGHRKLFKHHWDMKTGNTRKGKENWKQDTWRRRINFRQLLTAQLFLLSISFANIYMKREREKEKNIEIDDMFLHNLKAFAYDSERWRWSDQQCNLLMKLTGNFLNSSLTRLLLMFFLQAI